MPGLFFSRGRGFFPRAGASETFPFFLASKRDSCVPVPRGRIVPFFFSPPSRCKGTLFFPHPERGGRSDFWMVFFFSLVLIKKSLPPSFFFPPLPEGRVLVF